MSSVFQVFGELWEFFLLTYIASLFIRRNKKKKMQTIEKALHQPMPFTTGGQTITDRLTAAKHSLAGSQLGKTICKATTEELMAPKRKHLDCKFFFSVHFDM